MRNPTDLGRRTLLGGLAGLACAGPVLAQSPAASPVGGATIAEQLAAYASEVTFQALDARTVEATKAHLIDVIGCGIAAFNQPGVRAVRELAAEVPGSATLLGTTQRSTPDWATFANGVAMREFDLNDFYTGTDTGHPSDNISACLAVAEARQRPGTELIAAIVLSYEVVCRLLDGPRLSVRGWDHPVYSLPAVALAAGRLMGLPVPQLAQAVNLAVAPHVPLFQTRSQTISNWKGMADAEAGRNAVFAALLASRGITGPSPVFEGEHGLFKGVSGPRPVDVAQFGGRSGQFRINATSFKFYPAQAFIQTAVPAAASVRAQVGDPGQIRKVEIATTAAGLNAAANQPEKWAPRTSETADHSLPYVVGRTLLDGTLGVGSYSDEKLRDPVLANLLRNTTVAEDKAIPKIGNRVSVTLADGRVVSAQEDDLPGFAGRAVQRSDVEGKFRRNVGTFWPEERVNRILAAAWSLEQQADIGAFVQGFAA